MVKINCPVCKAELERGAVCPVCGWDTTADSELLPTLFPAAGTPSRAVRGEEYLARAAETAREALYLRFGRTVFAGQTTEDLQRCAEAEDPAEGVRRLAALLGVSLREDRADGPAGEARTDEAVEAASEFFRYAGEDLDLFPVPAPSSGGTREIGAALPLPRPARGNRVLRPSALLPSAADKDRIQAVRFQDSFRGLTLEHWDVSEARDGSVIACLREEFGLLTLLICGEDGVYAPEDCGSLFLDYKMLRSIDFGGCFHTENCTDMSNMFFGCLSLKALDMSGLDASRVRDARAMFSNCDGLIRVVLPRGLTAIQSHMFEHCTELQELGIPSGVVGVGDYAFYGCSSLETLALPDSVIGIGRYAFKECTALKNLALPRKLLHIDGGAFWSCTGLTEIIIPGSVNRIGPRACRGCRRLSTVYYVGSRDQWEKALEMPNDELKKAMIQFSL